MAIRAEDATGKRVLLINMPWGSALEPCLGLGILKGVLNAHGVGCDVIYASMRLLRYIKYDTWYLLAGTWSANDFVFTREFEPDVSPEQMQTLRRLVQDPQGCVASAGRALAPGAAEIAKTLRLREEVIPRFLDDLLAETDFSLYSMVGFTCLFDQTISSLALARRIRRAHPNILIAFGGYALQHPVGPALQRSFPEMDVVAYGDGEPVIFPLWQASWGMRPLTSVPNISYRDRYGNIIDGRNALKIDLDDSPTPDFDDFFLERERLREEHKISIMVAEIPVESSRGCWYGQKAHCTFCGIDDETLKYRVKSADTTLSQLDQLHRRYNVTAFRFSDYIMPLQYYKDFLPEMSARRAPYALHYETKANLKESQIRLCAQAGVRYLQPGIESFSSSLLRLMAKGVSAAQNIFTLYTMCRNRILPFYNLLFGFPAERASDYASMTRILPALYHMIPPQTTIPVQVTRFAPLAADPERFGACAPLKAHWRYGIVFSSGFLQENNLTAEDFCYYYENPYGQPNPELLVLHQVLQHQELKWKERFESGRAHLTYAETDDSLIVRDSRLKDDPQVYKFPKVHSAIGDVLRTGLFNVVRLFEEGARLGIDAQTAETALNELIQARIVLEVDGQYVWLAFPEMSTSSAGRASDPPRTNSCVRRSDEWPSIDSGSIAATETSQLVVIGSNP